MKHVARHEQRVGLFCGYPVAQLPEEVPLFLAPVIIEQLLPQVPVTGMYDFHPAYNVLGG